MVDPEFDLSDGGCVYISVLIVILNIFDIVFDSNCCHFPYDTDL